MGYLSTSSALAVIKSSWSDIFETPHIPWRGILICAHLDVSKSDSFLITTSLFSLNSSQQVGVDQVQTISWHRAGGGAGGGAGGADGGAGEENLIFRAAPQALVGRGWLLFWDLFLKPKRGNWRWLREVFRDKGALLGKLVEAEGLWRGLARLSWLGGHGGGYRPRLHETNKGLRSTSSSSLLTPTHTHTWLLTVIISAFHFIATNWFHLEIIFRWLFFLLKYFMVIIDTQPTPIHDYLLS